MYVSSAGCEPVAPTGLLAYELLASSRRSTMWPGWHGSRPSATSAMAHPFAPRARADRGALPQDTHRARRCRSSTRPGAPARYRPQLALDVLLAARDPADIATWHRAGRRRARCMPCRGQRRARARRACSRRASPGNVALLRFSSPAQIHPLIATRWVGAARAEDRDRGERRVLARARELRRAQRSGRRPARVPARPSLGEVEGEFANGHPRATGGSLPPAVFARLLRALGYPDAEAAAEPSGARAGTG